MDRSLGKNSPEEQVRASATKRSGSDNISSCQYLGSWDRNSQIKSTLSNPWNLSRTLDSASKSSCWRTCVAKLRPKVLHEICKRRNVACVVSGRDKRRVIMYHHLFRSMCGLLSPMQGLLSMIETVRDCSCVRRGPQRRKACASGHPKTKVQWLVVCQ